MKIMDISTNLSLIKSKRKFMWTKAVPLHIRHAAVLEAIDEVLINGSNVKESRERADIRRVGDKCTPAPANSHSNEQGHNHTWKKEFIPTNRLTLQVLTLRYPRQRPLTFADVSLQAKKGLCPSYEIAKICLQANIEAQRPTLPSSSVYSSTATSRRVVD